MHSSLKSVASPQRPQRIVGRCRLFLLIFFVFVLHASATNPETDSKKRLEGRVLSNTDQAQPGAIVYLKNSVNEQGKGSVSGSDGSYRFDGLAAGAEYQLWAEYKGKRSPTRNFRFADTKEPLSYTLKVDRTIADFLVPFGK